MAFETVELNEGSGGALIAADEIGGSYYPVSKVILGADGTNDGPVSATNPMPVSCSALPAGTNNIGDVDVASLPAGSWAGVTAITADYDTGAGTVTMPLVGVALPGSGGAVAGGTSTAPFRTDPMGTTAQPVTDNGGSLTVDGTVTAAQTTHDNLNANANLQVGNADVATGNPVPISDAGGSLTVDGSVSVSGSVAVTDGGGSLTVDGTVTVTDGSGSLTVDGSVSLASAIPAGTNSIGTTKDGGPSWTTSIGVSGVAFVSGLTTSAQAITDAPTSGQYLVLDDLIVSVPTACTVLIEDETSGADLYRLHFAGAGFAQITPRGKTKRSVADKKLTARVASGSTTECGITAYFHSEP